MFFYICRYFSKGEIIFYLNDYNGGSLYVCEYLIERIKRETRLKTIQQCSYLIVKGLVKSKTNDNRIFSVLDDLFDIPKAQEKPQKSKEELINEFEDYVKGV